MCYTAKCLQIDIRFRNDQNTDEKLMFKSLTEVPTNSLAVCYLNRKLTSNLKPKIRDAIVKKNVKPYKQNVMEHCVDLSIEIAIKDERGYILKALPIRYSKSPEKLPSCFNSDRDSA
ncbi:hypothetical protein QVD17_04990 [Tagetes erecta]|uniref:Uncharacterized protein n=1 Tax=Tagetes erecta TaxID=13708 RepID=A0AAD8LB60_TARER|nr:hypothetical protein QVD17_04990 [Tagetes erecta]